MFNFVKDVYKVAISTLTIISPRVSSRILYAIHMKMFLNLREPVWFSEKLMKLKLDNYLNNSIVWQCVDKLMMRDYAQRQGILEENMPKILGTYKDAHDINFDELPNKFALKCTHGAGFNIICTDKDGLDKKVAIKQLNKWLNTRFGLVTAETQYGKVRPSIICEEFIESDGNDLPNDYKVYCFNGKPRYVMACVERKVTAKVNIMDLEWNDTGYIKPGLASDKEIDKPKSLKKMLDMSGRISPEFPFVRIDFYENKGVPILGEMTFTPHACINSNMTVEGQVALGALIDINSRR